jgi:hypothetical protein
MGLLNLLNPIEAVGSIQTIVKDLKNYVFYRKQIKLIEAAGIFKTKKMRVDWLCRVYYVVNLEPELQLATGDLIDLEKSRVFESVSKIQGLFADRNLTEIVDVSSKRIKDDNYYAYLVTIKYRDETVMSDIVKTLIFGVMLYYLVHLGFWVGENWAVLRDSTLDKLNRK